MNRLCPDNFVFPQSEIQLNKVFSKNVKNKTANLMIKKIHLHIDLILKKFNSI